MYALASSIRSMKRSSIAAERTEAEQFGSFFEDARLVEEGDEGLVCRLDEGELERVSVE